MEKRNFTLSGVELRAKGDTEGRAKGYAAVFNSDSHDLGGFVERIKPGAFTRTLKGEHNIFALWAHRDDQPLASTGSGKLKLSEDEHGLAFDMDTTRMTPAQLDALSDGDLRMSFGFSVRDQEWREDDEGNIERTLVDVELYEVSFVISPAYPDTEAALRSLDAWKADRAAPEVIEETAEVEEVDQVLRAKLLARAILRSIK